MNHVSKLLESLNDLGQVIDLETVVPALIIFVDTLRVTLADGKLSIAESLKLASALFKVIEAAKRK